MRSACGRRIHFGLAGASLRPLQPVQVHPHTKQSHETTQERARESTTILRLLLSCVLRANRPEPLFQRLLPVRSHVLGNVLKIDMIRGLA